MSSRASLVGFVLTLALGVTVAGRASAKLLTTDPLTGLPLYPATDSRLHLGNEPTRLPASSVCKSRMQADFYSVYNSKVDATLAWYDVHLPRFKKTHAYAASRSQDAYYKPDGTIIVSVTGSAGKEGENTDAYSVTYARLQPGLSEKTIISLNQQKVVCPWQGKRLALTSSSDSYSPIGHSKRCRGLSNDRRICANLICANGTRINKPVLDGTPGEKPGILDQGKTTRCITR